MSLADWLHANPEIAWEEHNSAKRLAEILRTRGFDVVQNYLEFPTAFRATYGSGDINIGVIAEYDALPGLGHACGHNIISAIAVGAATALAAIADQLGITVTVYGTPAEEGGGGKIEMIDRGAFTELDFAMMAHPAPADVTRAVPYAVSHSTMTFTGKAAHAAAFPTEGINAADAMVIAQVAIGLLRQQLPATVRVHGVVTRGGEAPNAIAEQTVGRWYVRAKDLQELEETEVRVRRCFEAGALATGCTLEITPDSQPYSDFHNVEALEQLYDTNIRALGRSPITEGPEARMSSASTDMANVSHLVPAIHPYIGLNSYPISNHQFEFAAHCIGDAANAAIRDGAIALAWTAIDFAEQTSAKSPKHLTE
ncbi:M20 family metallopeptidase [Gulosibacter chungangensis]|uniref:Peptidase M20 domain-containing protein 2 n=1 Tax=Gulosibacter chungangensis TaxID=979746 RepID=A0A7J5BGA6_9MICO|nr:M20 family metallopeptidase [Gulosibacter chungangensis]